jgi:DNA-binding transcriptional LysR family regulator
MNANFRQLSLFLALCETRNITAVARQFHVTQPTVSMQLRELGDAIGLPLYEILGKKLHLTQAGEELERTARAMLGEWRSFEDRITHFKGLQGGHLSVAAVSTAQYFIPRLLGEFCQTHPDISLSLQILNRDGVVQRLMKNADDLYIMSKPPKNIDIEHQVLLPNPLVVIAPISHKFANQAQLSLKQVFQERFILREPGSGTRLSCDRFFKEKDIAPELRMELGSNEAIKQAVAGGMGLAILSRHALGEHLIDESLCVLEVEDFPIHSNWYSVIPQGKRLSPSAQAFLDYLHSQTEVVKN